jgi:hypothetical protein
MIGFEFSRMLQSQKIGLYSYNSFGPCLNSFNSKIYGLSTKKIKN